MSRTNRKYRRHSSGQAFVEIDGCRIYLGKYGTPESQERYHDELAKALRQQRTSAGSKKAGNCPTPKPAATDDDPEGPLLIVELLARYWKHAQVYYGAGTDQPSNELSNLRFALKPLAEYYGDLPVDQFRPRTLEALREKMIDLDWSRPYINAQVSRIRRVFKWGVSREYVEPGQLAMLKDIEPLKQNRTNARETEPVKPVPDEYVDAALPFMTPPVAAMVSLERLTGMRPGEVCQMRAYDLDMTGDVWTYRPAGHKNKWRKQVRIIAIGPRGQMVIRPFLTHKLTNYLFRPVDAVAWHREQLRKKRKTPVQPSQQDRRKRRPPKRMPGQRYTSKSYAKSIERACKKANAAALEEAKKQGRQLEPDTVLIPIWSPNRLRHSTGTAVRRNYGLEGSQVTLGHKHIQTSEIYSEPNWDLALKIAREIG